MDLAILLANGIVLCHDQGATKRKVAIRNNFYRDWFDVLFKNDSNDHTIQEVIKTFKGNHKWWPKARSKCWSVSPDVKDAVINILRAAPVNAEVYDISE